MALVRQPATRALVNLCCINNHLDTQNEVFSTAVVTVLPFLLLPAATWADDVATKTSNSLFIAKPYLQIGHTPAPARLQLLWHAPDTEADWSVEQRNGEALRGGRPNHRRRGRVRWQASTRTASIARA